MAQQNISPELLKQIQDYYSGPNLTGKLAEFGGQQYQVHNNVGGYAGEGGDGGSTFQNGYVSYAPGASVGDPYSMYDTQGDWQRDGVHKKDPWLQNLLIAAAGAYGMSMIPVGAAGAAGTAGSSSGLLSKAALDGTTAFGANSIPGAFALEGATVPGVFNAAMDSQLANAAIGPEALAGYTGTGGVTASPIGSFGGGSASTGSSWMDKLGSGLSSMTGGGSGTNSLLGLGATLLGGASGAQGQSADQSSTKNLPPWLQGPVANDLIPRTQQLLSQSMSPQMMQNNAHIRNTGMSLLSRPVAGNAFERFYGG